MYYYEEFFVIIRLFCCGKEYSATHRVTCDCCKWVIVMRNIKMKKKTTFVPSLNYKGI